MIITEFYNGQGLGNQLWCYFTLRGIALRNGYEFGIQSIHKFKGQEFLEINFGKTVIGGEGPEGGPPTSLPNECQNYYQEKFVSHNNVLVQKSDSKLINVPDSSKIDGCLQGLEYIKSYRKEIKSWISIKESYNITDFSKEDICIIHVRGGDFRGASSILDRTYYNSSVNHMLQKNINMKFFVVTDDYWFAKSLFPNFEIIGGTSDPLNSDDYKAGHHIGGPIWKDWTILYNSLNVITSASSFSFWPVWLTDKMNVIAPKYWGDYLRSDGYWCLGDSLVENWNYIDRSGNLFSYEECLIEKNNFEKQNSYIWKDKNIINYENI